MTFVIVASGDSSIVFKAWLLSYFRTLSSFYVNSPLTWPECLERRLRLLIKRITGYQGLCYWGVWFYDEF